jgi:hypothetical protein
MPKGIWPRKPPQERFDAKWHKDESTGCHIWIGATSRGGYGAFKDGATNRGAHRVAWEWAHGPIPQGLCVCHSCDTPACVNAAHMFLGTVADNMADRNAKGRQMSGPARVEIAARGEHNGQAKLTAASVLTIRRAYALGGVTQSTLAAEHGVDRSVISDALNRVTWTHI